LIVFCKIENKTVNEKTPIGGESSTTRSSLL